MKFSIITPSYNQGQYISQTIESVITQIGNYGIEYFVMDGGSTDNTVTILKDYEKKLKNNQRVKFYWQSRKDKGQSSAINEGIKKTTGDIVAYINSDDFYLPGAFLKVADCFENHKNKFWVVGNCRITDSKLKWTFFLKHIWPIHIFKNALYIFNTVNQPAVFVKKDLINRIGYFDQNLHYAFDYDYWLRCLDYSLPIRLFYEVATFRIHTDSKGNTGYLKQFEEDKRVLEKHNSNQIIKLIHKTGQKVVNFFYKFLK